MCFWPFVFRKLVSWLRSSRHCVALKRMIFPITMVFLVRLRASRKRMRKDRQRRSMSISGSSYGTCYSEFFGGTQATASWTWESSSSLRRWEPRSSSGQICTPSSGITILISIKDYLISRQIIYIGWGCTLQWRTLSTFQGDVPRYSSTYRNSQAVECERCKLIVE